MDVNLFLKLGYVAGVRVSSIDVSLFLKLGYVAGVRVSSIDGEQ